MNPVLQILGRLLADASFRTAAVSNLPAALSSYGYVLTARQSEIVANIVTSFASGRLDQAAADVNALCPFWPCHAMRDTLWQILGGMVVNLEYRTAMRASWREQLSLDGHLLTTNEGAIMDSIVGSFNQDKLDKTVAAISAECPFWPCSDPLMAP